MNTKLLVGIVSLWVVLGFSRLASAVPVYDAGDTLYPTYGIDTADVSTFPSTPTEVDEYLRADVDMDTNLPGILIFEFDVDNNAPCHGTAAWWLFPSCLGGSTLKEETGFDIAITVVLRTQGADAPTALCDKCYGPPGGGQCAARGQVCDPWCCAPSGGVCYWLAGACETGNCYIIGNGCTGPGNCPYCVEFDGACTAENPCGVARLYGEWYVTPLASALTGGGGLDRGRIDIPAIKQTATGDKDFYVFPWRRIVYNVHQFLLDDPGVNPECIFDIEAAKDSTNLRWQVSAYIDPDFATTHNDFMDMTTYCIEMVDVAPNVGKGTGTVTDKACCFGDTENDGDVDGSDAFRFKGDFFKCKLKQCPPIP